jgi:hypothetical protein
MSAVMAALVAIGLMPGNVRFVSEGMRRDFEGRVTSRPQVGQAEPVIA